MRSKIWGIMVLTAIGLTLEGAGGTLSSATLLVIPARPRTVQLAFDLARIRPITVVAYHGQANTAEPVLHVWSGADWQYVSLPDFADKAFLRGAVQKTIVIGDDQTVPVTLLHSIPWCFDIERLPTLNVADLINSLDRTLHFREREWKWLADRYGLRLTDLNAERRAKTRNLYNIPRSELPLEKREFKQEEGDLAPAELIEKQQPADVTAARATSPTKPVEKPPK